MEKLKIYIMPSMEVLAYTAQNIMKVSGHDDSDLPPDLGDLPAPRHRTPVF